MCFFTIFFIWGKRRGGFFGFGEYPHHPLGTSQDYKAILEQTKWGMKIDNTIWPFVFVLQQAYSASSSRQEKY